MRRNGRDAHGAAAPSTPAWFKDTSPFIVHDDGKSLEARLENMPEGLITPVREFFVRNNSVSLDVDVESWRLSIEGDAVTNPIQLSYRRHPKLPTHGSSRTWNAPGINGRCSTW